MKRTVGRVIELARVSEAAAAPLEVGAAGLAGGIAVEAEQKDAGARETVLKMTRRQVEAEMRERAAPEGEERRKSTDDDPVPAAHATTAAVDNVSAIEVLC